MRIADDLKPHNKETYEKLKEVLKTNNKTCAIQPTGSGKSYLILKLIEDYAVQNRDIIVIEPQKYIFEQLQKKMKKYGLPVEKVKFVTYSALGKLDEEKVNQFISPNLVLVDEMHRAGAPKWGNGLQKMFDFFPDDCKYIGFSATPIRFLDGKRNMAEELFDGCIASEIGLADAILDRILPLPRYIAGLYTYENEVNAITRKIQKSYNTDEEKAKLLEEVANMKKNLDKSKGVSAIFNKYIDGNGKYVAFCRNVNHLKLMRSCLEQWFSEAGISCNFYEVHCKNPEKDKQFKAFMDDKELSVCLSVAVLSEGVHGIDGVILLRNTISPNLYYQQIGRAFTIDMDTVPIIFDLVANCEAIMDCSLKNDLLEVIDRRDRDKIIKEKTCINERQGNDEENNFNNYDSKEISKEDIKEFFVFDQVIDSVSAFRSIECKLNNSWDIYIKALEQYKKREGNCLVPQKHIEILGNSTKLNLGRWVVNIRQTKKGHEIYKLSVERIEQLEKLGFVWNTEDRYSKFYRYALLYREKYGHTDIKVNDKINEYAIGREYRDFIRKYRDGKLTSEQINRLKNIGVDIGCGKFEKRFREKMRLAQDAFNEGIVITHKNQIYKNCNLYSWYKKNKQKFTKKEIKIMEKLIPDNTNKRKIAIIDVKNENIYSYPSIAEAGRALYNDFHIVETEQQGKNIIFPRVSGQVKNHLYKDQFRFDYV